MLALKLFDKMSQPTNWVKFEKIEWIKEKHKVPNQSKASNAEESYFVTEEENRLNNLKWSIQCSNIINSQVLYLLTVKTEEKMFVIR